MELKDPRLAKGILLGLCAGGLFYFWFGTPVLPFSYPVRAKQIRELEGRQADLTRQLDQARRTASGLAALETEEAELQGRWALARRLLPDENQIASLLREITVRGNACGVEFTLFKPRPTVPREFYSEKPVEVKVEGGYHAIARFLAKLATMDRIVQVRDLQIEQSLDAEPGGPTAHAQFVAVAYVLGVPPAAAPAPEEQPGKKPGGLVGAAKKLVDGREKDAPTGAPAGAKVRAVPVKGRREE
jgi:type IV pilus assembly protein PilO